MFDFLLRCLAWSFKIAVFGFWAFVVWVILDVLWSYLIAPHPLIFISLFPIGFVLWFVFALVYEIQGKS